MIITVSVKSKRMKFVIRVFAENNVKDSRDYKLTKEPTKLLHWLTLNLVRKCTHGGHEL